MGKYGVKIKIIAAASIYDMNLGVRQQLDIKDAMLTNSLFLDFLSDNGLSLWKNSDSTRDVITLTFDYGTRSYEEDVGHLKSLLEKCDPNDTARQNRLIELIQRAEQNKDKYHKLNKQELRREYYNNGVNITYYMHNKAGEVINSQTVHYKMLFRSAGFAKRGKCMFICDRLYDKAHNFLTMGIKMQNDDAQIVEMGAYSSLVASGIIGRIHIEPENILILDDFDSYSKTDVVSIEVNDKNECVAVHREDYEIKNTMFDGQALIDSSIFPSDCDGYILLRHHFFKAAAFCTHIQKFFKDHYGEGYDTAVIKDRWGNEHRAKDIRLITTVNACKWIKFNVSYEYWCNRVHANGNTFGIVKTSHKSKLGDFQKMSYQFVNSLDINTMDESMKCSIDYLERMKTDEKVFLEYLDRDQNFSNDYSVLIALVKHNPTFVQSSYYRERKNAVLKQYVRDMKTGKLIQSADNLTIVGSPYAMLMWSVGGNPEKDPTFNQESGLTECWTARFDDGEYLAELRSPFNSRNNMGYMHNRYHPYFDKYFEFGKQIVAINMVHTSFQDRNNGSDQDSDMVYVTNAKSVVEHAKYCIGNYKTVVNNIPKEKNHYANTLDNYALIDSKLAKAQLAIGESSNLAQLCLTYTYNFRDEKFDDYVCILSVIAQAAIDSAKRSFVVDIPKEIKRIKKLMNLENNGYPKFWTLIRHEFQKYKILKNGDHKQLVNEDLKCPMNVLYEYKAKRFNYSSPTVDIKEYFTPVDLNIVNHYYYKRNKKVEELMQKFSLKVTQINSYDGELEDGEVFLLREDFDDMIESIRRTSISGNYQGLMSWLLNRAFCITDGAKKHIDVMDSRLYKNRSLLIKVLYDTSPKTFLMCFDGHKM